MTHRSGVLECYVHTTRSAMFAPPEKNCAMCKHINKSLSYMWLLATTSAGKMREYWIVADSRFSVTVIWNNLPLPAVWVDCLLYICSLLSSVIRPSDFCRFSDISHVQTNYFKFSSECLECGETALLDSISFFRSNFNFFPWHLEALRRPPPACVITAWILIPAQIWLQTTFQDRLQRNFPTSLETLRYQIFWTVPG
jgi:hypothetical protein